MRKLLKTMSFVVLVAIFMYNIILATYYMALITNIQNRVVLLSDIEKNKTDSYSRSDRYRPEYTGGGELETVMAESAVGVYMLGDGKSGTCSGTIIDEYNGDHLVLTAKHCIGRTEEMYVDDSLVKLVVGSTVDDLSLLVVDGLVSGKKPIILANDNAEILEAIHHVGYPSGEYYISTGYVRRLTKRNYEANLSGVPGCSGGGIFNDSGKLVGVLWGGTRSHKHNITLYVPINKVHYFLNQVQSFFNN